MRRSFLKTLTMTLMGAFYFPLQASFRKACRTASDATGPFYRRNAPFRKNVAAKYSGKAEQLIVTGTVYGIDCNQPLSFAEVDIWHAGPEGNYDNSTPEFRFRGIVKTDTNGKYKFQTVLPGIYGSRPRHIHYKVRHRNFKELTTQLYFKGDKYLKNDPTSRSSNGTERAREYAKNERGIYEMNFDLYLA